MKYKTPMHNTFCPKPMQYKNTMNQQATAYAELLKICLKHGASKAMFDDIVTWVQHHTKKDPTTFLPQSTRQKWARKKLMNHLTDVFSFGGLKPKLQSVELHDGRIVTVPIVDFAESMRSILDDKTVMKRIITGIDLVTWRPVVRAEEHEANMSAMLKDKVDGYLYRQGIELHCPDETECDPVKVRPFPVILHIDKSHSDLFGNLAVAPVQCMPAMFDTTIQQYSSAWRQIATVPNLSAGKGKDGRKSKDSLWKLEDFHKVNRLQDSCTTTIHSSPNILLHQQVMHVALSSFKQYYEAGGFLWMDENGNEVVLKPYLHMCIADISGMNELLGHFNTCKARCVVKDCKCSHNDLLLCNPPKCQQVKWTEIQQCSNIKEIFDLYESKNLVSERDMTEMMVNKDVAQFISKHPITNAFDSLPLSDPYQGLIGMTPQEILHLMGGGMHKYFILVVRDIIGENGTNSAVKGLINDVFPDVKQHLQRNAERDVCRMSNRNGFFNVSSLTSSEVRGNFFGLVTLMHTTYGESLLSGPFEEAGVNYQDML
ncbi:MAG: hypothetical protein ACO3PG_05370, partial [Pelagibacteraceae bacterium]